MTGSSGNLLKEHEVPESAFTFRTVWPPETTTADKKEPIRMSVAAFAADREGGIYAIPSPVKPTAARLLKLSQDGTVLREYALNLVDPADAKPMNVFRVAARSGKVMVFSTNGLAKTYVLP